MLFFRSVSVTALVCLAVAGCGGSGIPPTHTVKGKVVFKGGNIKLLEGGVVELESVSNPEIAAQGEIGPDGSFSVSTIRKDGQATSAGAIAGEHRVRVRPPNPREEESRKLIDLRFWEFATSGIKTTVPADQEFVIEVRRPRR